MLLNFQSQTLKLAINLWTGTRAQNKKLPVSSLLELFAKSNGSFPSWKWES